MLKVKKINGELLKQAGFYFEEHSNIYLKQITKTQKHKLQDGTHIYLHIYLWITEKEVCIHMPKTVPTKGWGANDFLIPYEQWVQNGILSSEVLATAFKCLFELTNQKCIKVDIEQENIKNNKKMKKIGKYWVDEGGNKWETNKYTEEWAKSASKSLKNCKDCVNCTYCIDCINCTNCHACDGCFRCINCHTSNRCKDCKGCDDCADGSCHEHSYMYELLI